MYLGIVGHLGPFQEFSALCMIKKYLTYDFLNQTRSFEISL